MLKIVSEHRHTTGLLLRQRTSQRQRMTGMCWLLSAHAPTNALTIHTTHESASTHDWYVLAAHCPRPHQRFHHSHYPCLFVTLLFSLALRVELVSCDRCPRPAPLSAAVEHRLQVRMPRLGRTRTPQRADTFAVQHTHTHTHTHTFFASTVCRTTQGRAGFGWPRADGAAPETLVLRGGASVLANGNNGLSFTGTSAVTSALRYADNLPPLSYAPDHWLAPFSLLAQHVCATPSNVLYTCAHPTSCSPCTKEVTHWVGGGGASG